MTAVDDFFEEDEPIEDIRAALANGRPVVTAAPDRVVRTAGGRWRLLVKQRGEMAHHVGPTRNLVGDDGEYRRAHMIPGTEFDELVVGSWLHVEQMDRGHWWMSVAGVVLLVSADRDGKARCVSLFAPGQYDDPLPGVEYHLPDGTVIGGKEAPS